MKFLFKVFVCMALSIGIFFMAAFVYVFGTIMYIEYQNAKADAASNTYRMGNKR